MLWFVLVIFVASGVLYALRGAARLAYIDCLFISTSAMTVTGLTTVPLSQLTLAQQIVVFVLMVLGNLIVDSLLIVLLRRQAFGTKLHKFTKRNASARARAHDIELQERVRRREEAERVRRFFGWQDAGDVGVPEKHTSGVPRLDEPARAVDKPLRAPPCPAPPAPPAPDPAAAPIGAGHVHVAPVPAAHARRTPRGARPSSLLTSSDLASRPRAALHQALTRNMNRGLGGFPSPIDWVMGILESFHWTGRLNVPETSTAATVRRSAGDAIDADGETVRLVPYLSFDATVTGNSNFPGLTHAQRVELGGVEYRALDVLAWLIPVYWLGWMALSLVIVLPYLASAHAARVRDAIADQPQPPPSTSWYWVFTTLAAMTNAGWTLTDNSFERGLRDAYMLLVPVTILSLVGNTAYPVMLRLLIWALSQCIWKESHLYETLRFLLDHPRRCFLYLFPRGNTLFLLALILLLTISDWVLLLVLDLNRRKDTVTIGAWVYDGLVQSLAIRSAGYQTFHILDLAPAVQMMQVLMMYLNDFPLTMAVRTTNVFEKGSLSTDDDTPRPASAPVQGRAIWGRFLADQVRRQLAFDLWWIALAVWIVLIAEQGKIEDRERYPNLTVFTILYEMISAYGTVGLSCGAQYLNTSMSGDFGVFSKLIMIAVMVRGRHRGLPNAIDRAIMLPNELLAYEQLHDLHGDDDSDTESSGLYPPDADSEDPKTPDDVEAAARAPRTIWSEPA